MLCAGRGGSCELMIGCIAKAAATELHPDMEEMDDVRWIHKDIIKRVVHASSKPEHPYMGESVALQINCGPLADCVRPCLCTSESF